MARGTKSRKLDSLVNESVSPRSGANEVTDCQSLSGANLTDYQHTLNLRN